MNTIKELRTSAGMTQKAFAEYFGISKRAIESWEGGKRECPAYLFELMKYKLEKEGITVKETDADDAPRKCGEWITESNGVVICSECGEEHEWDDFRPPYCDMCGARNADNRDNNWPSGAE